MMADKPAPAPAKKRIAVVAVHGVADQEPCTSARAIARLLLNFDRRRGRTQYKPFTEVSVRIATRSIYKEPVDSEAVKKERKLHSAFEDRAQFMVAKGDAGTADEQLPVDFKFMRDQLRLYRGDGPDGAFETLQLEGGRLNPDGIVDRDVHIFEMYWADLSRLGRGALRIVGEFYQLLFHAANLGRHAVDLAVEENRESRLWRTYGWCNTWAARTLTLAIPWVALFMLAVSLLIVPVSIPSVGQPYVALIVLFLAVAGGTGFLLFINVERTGFWSWVFVPIGAAVISLGAVIWLIPLLPFGDRLGWHHLLAIEWLGTASLGIWLLTIAYEKRRPGTLRFTLWGGTGTLALTLALILANESSSVGVLTATLVSLEVLNYGAFLAWATMLILSIGAAVFGTVAVLMLRWGERGGDKQRYDRARRAAWTGRLTLAIPTAMFMVTTIVVWTVVYLVGSRFIPAAEYEPRLLHSFETGVDGTLPMSEFARQLLIEGSTPAFIYVLAGLGLAMLIAMWALLPSVVSEFRVPQGDSTPSGRHGLWLDRGFHLLRVAGEILFVSVTVILPVAIAIQICRVLHAPIPKFLMNDPEVTHGVLFAVATALIGSATGLLVLRGKLESLALGLRPVLDIALDVGNHLKLLPRETNPRARIMARYLSLLRYLCNWKDPLDGRGYDAIVIIAHSQGAVITADLFRFLAIGATVDDNLGKLRPKVPVHYFSMGSPLRQLYRLRFPHLYKWIGTGVGNSEAIPGAMGLASWTNAYRSGDYVGRHLWCDDTHADRWQCEPSHNPNKSGWVTSDVCFKAVWEHVPTNRREFCVGPGAHQHYWGGDAACVGAELDRLICL